MSKANKLRRQAQDLLKKGKLDKAIGVYKKLLYGSSSNPNLSNELGDIYLRTGDRIQAVSSFENALENYEKVALYNNAVAVCKKILRVVPGRLTTIYRLGEIKVKQNFLAEAAGYFLKYIELLLADSKLLVEGTDERIENILELMVGYPGVVSKAVDVLVDMGMVARAAEVNAKLIQDNSESGDKEVLEFYNKRMGRLKSSLSEEEREKIDRILDSIKISDLPGPEDKMDIRDVVSETVVGNEDVLKDSGDFSLQPGSDNKSQSETVIDKNHEEDITGEDRSEAIARDEDAEADIGTSESIASSDNDGRDTAEDSSLRSPRVIEEPFPPPELDDQIDMDAGADAEEVLENEENENRDFFEDLSDIKGLDGADETNDAEQITSDVEKDDFRSHYDLGMAYIEMALFDEAIKELQISSRSPELSLRSIEMIGHCFIQKGDFRLAVKQLERGEEISSKSNDENLGIHYNLGLAYEALDNVEKAREHFEEVYIVDVTFRDIPEKMKKLKSLA